MKNIKILFLFLCLSFISTEMNAQANSNRISLGIGALYERGFDFTIELNMKQSITMLGSILPTAILNMQKTLV